MRPHPEPNRRIAALKTWIRNLINKAAHEPATDAGRHDQLPAQIPSTTRPTDGETKAAIRPSEVCSEIPHRPHRSRLLSRTRTQSTTRIHQIGSVLQFNQKLRSAAEGKCLDKPSSKSRGTGAHRHPRRGTHGPDLYQKPVHCGVIHL